MRRGWRGLRVRAESTTRPAKADGGGGLDKLLGAVNAAAAQGRVMWLSLLGLGTYLLVVVGGTTHRDLLLGATIKLPILTTELPLFTFYWAAPVLFVLFHLYMLLKLDVIAGKLALFEDGLAATLSGIGDEAKRAKADAAWRAQLDAFLYLQMCAAEPRSLVQRALIRAAVWFTVVIGPVLLLLAFQIRFLPYHHEVMTWAHRGFVAIDLLLLLLLWPVAAGGRGAARWLPIAAFAALALPISVLIATIPGETEKWGLQAEYEKPWRLTQVLFEGEWDEVKRTAGSPFSRNITLQDEVLIDRDTLEKVKTTLNLRGRDLRDANFAAADLRKADFYTAELQGAKLAGAQLQGANLLGAELQGANLAGAQLQGASLLGAELQGADLLGAELQGANLAGAQLQGASLLGAELQGADLYGAHLQGANLRYASLQGAYLLGGAELQGAYLGWAELQGANLDGAQLQGANLAGSGVWRSVIKKADLTLADLRIINLNPMAPEEVEALKTKVGEAIADPDHRDKALQRLEVLGEEWDAYREAEARYGWGVSQSEQLPEPMYEAALAAYLAELACDPEHAPFVASGIARRLEDVGGTPPHAPLVATALLDPGCAGAKGLDEEPRARLQKIVDKAAAKP